MEERPKSIYHSGASDGIILGAYMSGAFILHAIGANYPFISVLAQMMVLGTPVLAYYLMKRGYVEHPTERPFSTLWMHGITIFICGSLLLGIVEYVYMRFIDPMFITNFTLDLADTYESMQNPEYKHIGHTLRLIVSKHLLPTPISFSFSMIWFVSFAGCIITLLISAIIKLVYKNRN